MSAGNEFHAVGPATENVRSPSFLYDRDESVFRRYSFSLTPKAKLAPGEVSSGKLSGKFSSLSAFRIHSS